MDDQRMMADDVTGVALPRQKPVLRIVLELREIGTLFQFGVAEFRVLVRGDGAVEFAPFVRAGDILNATALDRYWCQRDPQRDNVVAQGRPEGQILMPIRCRPRARFLDEGL